MLIHRGRHPLPPLSLTLLLLSYIILFKFHTKSFNLDDFSNHHNMSYNVSQYITHVINLCVKLSCTWTTWETFQKTNFYIVFLLISLTQIISLFVWNFQIVMQHSFKNFFRWFVRNIWNFVKRPNVQDFINFFHFWSKKLKTNFKLKVFQLPCRIFCVFTRSPITVALLLNKNFPAVLKTPSEWVFEKDMQKLFLAKEVSDRYLV